MEKAKDYLTEREMMWYPKFTQINSGAKMRLETTLNRKSVNIYNNGDLWVAGKNTGLRQWESDSRRWSNQSGRELPELKGKSLEEVLKIKGYIGSSRIREGLYRNIGFIPFGNLDLHFAGLF